MSRLAESVLVALGLSSPFGSCGVFSLYTTRKLMAPSYGIPCLPARKQLGGFSNVALWASAARALIKALADVPILNDRKWVRETDGGRCGVAA